MNGQIFNFYQANLFIKHGAIVEGCGIEKHTTYIQFKTDNYYYNLLDKWNKRTLK